MIGVRNFSSPIRLRRKRAGRASGFLVLLLLWPVGLAGQETCTRRTAPSSAHLVRQW